MLQAGLRHNAQWIGAVPSDTDAQLSFVRMQGSTATPFQPAQLPSDEGHTGLPRLLQDNFVFIRYHAAIALKVGPRPTEAIQNHACGFT